jgi:hypothetical protein
MTKIYIYFDEAVLVVLNTQTSEFHKNRQWSEWLLWVREQSEYSLLWQ